MRLWYLESCSCPTPATIPWRVDPCTSPGQHIRVGPGGTSEGEPALRVGKQESWHHPLLQAALGGLVETVLESLPGSDNERNLEG